MAASTTVAITPIKSDDSLIRDTATAVASIQALVGTASDEAGASTVFARLAQIEAALADLADAVAALDTGGGA